METKQIQELKEKVSQLVLQKDKTKNASEKVNTEMWDTIQPLEDKIKEVEKPYKEKISKLGESIRKQEDEIRKVQDEVKRLEQVELINQAKKLGKYNVETLKALFNSLEFNIPTSWDSEPVIEKKQLKNGIQIFRFLDERSHTEWFFFHETKLVGYSFRRAGEHRGDTTYPYSFLAPCNDMEKVIKVTKENRWKHEEELSATFTDFSKLMSEKNPKELKEINMSNPKVQEIIKLHNGMRY